jgi:hypothetical protein
MLPRQPRFWPNVAMLFIKSPILANFVAANRARHVWSVPLRPEPLRPQRSSRSPSGSSLTPRISRRVC